MIMRDERKRKVESFFRLLFFLFGLVSVACVLVIAIYLIVSGLPAIRKIGLSAFLFGTTWAPTAGDPSYGILPFILTSVYGTAGALLLGGPLGVLCAVYLSKYAPRLLRQSLENLVSLLASVPSVVYGLLGMMVIVPWIRATFSLADGSGLLAAMLVLSVMILPTVIKVSLVALDAVPREIEEAALALGTTPSEAYFTVSLPAARAGITSALVLGIGRATGEAMAVMMVAGNVANMPSLFQSVRFLTTAISSEMSYATGLARQALFSIALVLFLFGAMISALARVVMKKARA